MFDPDIAPSGTLLGLLQRGRGDGTLHALAAPRAEALAALNDSVLRDPRRDWQVENRSLYYARLYMQLDGGLEEIERHLFHPDDRIDTGEERTGLALAVLGHLASYGRDAARLLLRSYAAVGSNWRWALDELALRDDDAGLMSLAPAVLARFPQTAQGAAELAATVRDAFEPRPWRLWAEDARYGARLVAAKEDGSFDRWQRQLRPRGPRPGWSVAEVLEWAQQELEPRPEEHRYLAAARCLSAVAGPEDRAELLRAGRGGPDAARAAVLHHLAERGDAAVLDLVEEAVTDPLSAEPLIAAALCAYERMRSVAAVEQARIWAARADRLGASAAAMLARRGARRDTGLVLAALRRTVREEGPNACTLWELVDGAGRLGIACAAPVLRHLYRETSSSQLRGRAAAALASTDPGFPAGFAVECLWDCEEATRELAARHAATADDRVVEQLRRLAADPAEEAEVQTAVRARIEPDAPAV
ncbi:HEAT repeat domain-containing protein [Streptomyces sp. NPDC090442]|uniref:HEAT repeat domain-containing protein n=1 Tax=Streptomyces sp. NPDC090442 TaxID=3365962 RepID=UPI00382F349A